MVDLFNKENKKGTKYDFVCPWCGNEFSQYVKQSTGDKHSKVTSQVRCKRCKVFLKSFSGKESKRGVHL